VALSMQPLNDALGVEVTGIDLSLPISTKDKAAMEQALIDHLVLVVRDQSYSPAQYLTAVRHFGDTMEQHLSDLLMDDHPEIAVLDSRNSTVGNDGRGIPLGSRDWHTDHTNHAKPPKMTAMYAISLPRAGGDTGFANMYMAFDALPEKDQTETTTMKTANVIEDNPYVSDDHKERFGKPQFHPLIRTHPVTGKKAVFVHPGKARWIEGMDEDESHAYIDRLMSRAIQPENTYRHQWRIGDLVMWDNRSVSHIAYRDYDHMDSRVMHRVILAGDTPY
jgi:taurine dioxygenase